MMRQEKYLAHKANPNNPFTWDVSWPINSSTGWFRELSVNDVDVRVIDSTTVEISWSTPGYQTDGEVRYTLPGGPWWVYEQSGPIDIIPDLDSNGDPVIDDEHCIEITLAEAGTYEFRIRSTNDTNNPPDLDSQIIWGYVGSFTTSP